MEYCCTKAGLTELAAEMTVCTDYTVKQKNTVKQRPVFNCKIELGYWRTKSRGDRIKDGGAHNRIRQFWQMLLVKFTSFKENIETMLTGDAHTIFPRLDTLHVLDASAHFWHQVEWT